MRRKRYSISSPWMSTPRMVTKFFDTLYRRRRDEWELDFENIDTPKWEQALTTPYSDTEFRLAMAFGYGASDDRGVKRHRSVLMNMGLMNYVSGGNGSVTVDYGRVIGLIESMNDDCRIVEELPDEYEEIKKWYEIALEHGVSTTHVKLKRRPVQQRIMEVKDDRQVLLW